MLWSPNWVKDGDSLEHYCEATRMGGRWETESHKKLPNLEQSHPRVRWQGPQISGRAVVGQRNGCGWWGSRDGDRAVGEIVDFRSAEGGSLTVELSCPPEGVSFPSAEWYKPRHADFSDGMVWKGEQRAGLHASLGP